MTLQGVNPSSFNSSKKKSEYAFQHTTTVPAQATFTSAMGVCVLAMTLIMGLAPSQINSPSSLAVGNIKTHSHTQGASPSREEGPSSSKWDSKYHHLTEGGSLTQTQDSSPSVAVLVATLSKGSRVPEALDPRPLG